MWAYGVPGTNTFHTPAFTIEARAGRPVRVTWVNSLMDSGGRALWAISAMLRLSALAAAVTLALLSGHAHPLGIVAGLSVLPIAVIARGLRDARGEG